MAPKSKIRQRLSDISFGFMLAMTVVETWRWGSDIYSHFVFYDLLMFSWIILGFALWLGRKLAQRSASKVLVEDKRPPVVYLRSFKDDKRTSIPLPIMIASPNFPIFFTEEEILVDVLHDFGPCVAIGQPGEKLPDLGAARMYLDNNAWQDKVRELLISARLVVLRAGNTGNLLWEVEQSVKNVGPKNIIILIPKKKNIYSQFHARANQYFPKPLPKDIELFHIKFVWGGMASLYGYIHFDEDWTAHVVKFEIQTPFW